MSPPPTKTWRRCSFPAEHKRCHTLFSQQRRGELIERRTSPRVERHGPVSFRTAEDSDYRTGFLANISTTGAMLWLEEELEIGDEIEVVMQSEFDPAPVHMKMRVTRMLPQPRNGFRGYGCSLELHEPWENE
ncbi:MAG: hypothetical protein DSZ00_04845 [Gammaproteobacteria bacterium]|nr:MAG: hypothetical protein DSZ00_04845 [Gammaproteobacteria bacterium]RTZ80614.1 MAG: hypothetical protein DSZ01_01980 [Gammaproteobacteria bacterium]